MNTTTITLASLLAADPNLAVVYNSSIKGLRPPPNEHLSDSNEGQSSLCLTFFGGHQILIHLLHGTPFALSGTSGVRTWVRVGEFNPTWHRI